jgi:DNA-binding transcriptional LysR family regulator
VPKGLLRVDLPVTLGRQFIVPALQPFVNKHSQPVVSG